jgi:alanine dehydrogenase
MNKPVFITEAQVAELLTPETANRCVERAFKEFGKGHVLMPSKVYLDTPDGDFRAMPAYARGIAGIKWISVFPDNRKYLKPAVIGTLLINNVKTGELLAIAQANTLTAYRTGAAGATASKYLAAKDSRTLLLVGAGVQSEYQLKCHLQFFAFDRVFVWSQKFTEAANFVRRFKTSNTKLLAVSDLRGSARQADIISTCTPSRKPLLKASWIKPGAHINAIGADAPGKQELEPEIVRRSRVFVDDWAQAHHSGEINKAVRRGNYKRRHIAGHLHDVILRRIRPRVARDQVTVFDSTGLAIQDILVGQEVYRGLLAKRGRNRLECMPNE